MEATGRLVALIEDMMIDESKRFVALRLKRENLPVAERDDTHEEMQRLKTTLQSLGHFRASVLEKRYSGIELPAVFSARARAVVRDELRVQDHSFGPR
jgi:hypothetical protein